MDQVESVSQIAETDLFMVRPSRSPHPLDASRLAHEHTVRTCDDVSLDEDAVVDDVSFSAEAERRVVDQPPSARVV